jgi:beta-lactamase class A
MYRGLTRSFWNGEALSQLPPWVQAASKQGAVDAARGEVVLVNAPSGDYVFCVTTKNLADTTWAASNQGFVLLRKVSALLWKTFEPRHPWAPDPGAAALKPSEE